jgi:SAM-dependent methyltransferase
MNSVTAQERFRTAYAEHRAAEGRRLSAEELRSLPHLTAGPLARAWGVRAATFEAFRRRVVHPLATQAGRPLRILDLGAGNGWLSYRLSLEGHGCTALDVRDDDVDGLGAAGPLLEQVHFTRLTASFDTVPLPDAAMDLSVFNASLHYATDLEAVLAEAVRVTAPGGCIAILDSPFYAREAAGAAMVAEKHRTATETFGVHADALLALPFVEFLTRERLARASASLGLQWRRRRVRYPLWYETRGLFAALRGQRPPSRFDFWTTVAP